MVEAWAVTEQSANDWQAKPATGTEVRIGVPQIVEAHASRDSDGLLWRGLT